MQTITVKYLAETETLNARYKATHSGAFRSITIPTDYSLSNSDENYVVAAKALADALGWEGEYIGGHTKEGMVFVNAAPLYSFTAERGVE